MNKFLTLVVLALFMITLVPGLGLFNQGHVVNTSATSSSNSVTVLFVLNESKEISVVFGSTQQYDYADVDQTGYVVLPANKTILLESWYPFEVNGSPAYHYWGDPFAYFINFTHNTIVYINFVQNASLMRLPIINATPLPPSTTTLTRQPISPTEGITLAIGSLVLVITVVIIVSVVASKRGKK